MYTIADIYNIAIQIERNGEAEYRQAAQQTTDAEMKKLYLEMARQEAEHAAWFARLLEKTPDRQVKEDELDELGAELLQNIVKEARFPVDGKGLDEIDNMHEALMFSIALEEDTITFYQFLSDLLEDKETQQDIEQIIREEKRHIEKLREVSAQWQQQQQ